MIVAIGHHTAGPPEIAVKLFKKVTTRRHCMINGEHFSVSHADLDYWKINGFGVKNPSIVWEKQDDGCIYGHWRPSEPN